ncbi:peptidoglycan-recognition protein SC1a-like [Diadema antillarum]|uniref:peptidoglycan-recognition protein SC1a-like n=1 Tax=Diadema antillarum TaxID=105358 RepID=UPI003A8BB962
MEDGCPVIISRAEWGARPPVDSEPLSTPTPYAVIFHTVIQTCESADACKLSLRKIQNFHMDFRGWWDIGYNFLIGGDGNVYEGRGLERKGAHARSYNQYSIGLCCKEVDDDILDTEKNIFRLFDFPGIRRQEGEIRGYEVSSSRQLLV